MSFVIELLDDLRREIEPDELTIKTARQRRDDALDGAKEHPGVARGYNSGSIAHATANSDTDADCGIVLDRRVWPELGPDGDGVGPCDVVEDVRSLVRSYLLEIYPGVKTWLTKRAIQLKFHDPLANDTDPSVDLIVGLQRKDGGLWIPNLPSNSWDASDPIRHTELLTAPPKALRVLRARVVRLGKCWNCQYTEPGMCSFNVEALALASVTEDLDLATGLAEFFRYAASDVARRNTPDPAEVSKPIKLKIDRQAMVDRLRGAATLMEETLDHGDDEDAVRTSLADLFWKHLDPAAGANSKAAWTRSLRTGNSGVSMGADLALGTSGTRLKTTRSFGSGTS